MDLQISLPTLHQKAFINIALKCITYAISPFNTHPDNCEITPKTSDNGTSELGCLKFQTCLKYHSTIQLLYEPCTKKPRPNQTNKKHKTPPATSKH